MRTANPHLLLLVTTVAACAEGSPLARQQAAIEGGSDDIDTPTHNAVVRITRPASGSIPQMLT